MIATDKRKAVFLLHQEGMAGAGDCPPAGREPQHGADHHRARGRAAAARCAPTSSAWMRSCCAGSTTQCQGRIVRVHEKLVEEEGVAVSLFHPHATAAGVGHQRPPKAPAASTCPMSRALEMQHDTSLYQVELAGRRVTADRQPDLPALLQTPLPQVLPRL